MKRSVLIMMLGLTASLALFSAVPGWAQEGQVEITVPPPERAKAPALISPGQPPEITRPRETDFRPDNIRTRHDPAFITPFTTTIQTGPTTAVRVGLSGWTAPPARDNFVQAHENSGLFALGVTVIWDVPVSTKPGTGGIR